MGWGGGGEWGGVRWSGVMWGWGGVAWGWGREWAEGYAGRS